MDTDSSGAEEIVFVIRDDGPGIPQDQRQMLETGAETALEHGTGIGMWIIDWLVTKFGGELTIEDRTPRGTRLTIRLPGPAQ